MAKRRVKKSGKDEDGDITKLCNSDGDWKTRTKSQAIADIEGDHHSYYVEDSQGRQSQVIQGSTGKYLRTDPDGRAANNLDNLPDC